MAEWGRPAGARIFCFFIMSDRKGPLSGPSPGAGAGGGRRGRAQGAQRPSAGGAAPGLGEN